MIQKIRLGPDGVITSKRMQPYISGQAQQTPAVKLGRLQKLIKTKTPHICVVRGEGIGDVLMTTPTVRALRKSFGGRVIIHYATNTRYLDGALVKVLQYNPDINEILERQLLDDSKYDLVVNLHCPCIWYEKPGNPPVNRIDLFANHAGVRPTSTDLAYYIQKDEISAGAKLVSHLQGKKVILVQPSASSERRSLDHGKLKAALTQLSTAHGIMSLVLTHSSDFGTDVLWDNIPGCKTMKDLDVRQIAGLMVHCDLVLCPDSSILHLAGALKVPTVAFFGPTHPAARINYYPNAVAIWKGEGLKPCPCWYDACPISEACWGNTGVNDIVTACLEHLRSTSRVDISQLTRKSNTVTISTEII